VAWLSYQGEAWISQSTLEEFELHVIRPLIEAILDPSKPFSVPDFLGEDDEA